MRSGIIMSLRVIDAASPILMPVLIRRSIKAASRIKVLCAKGVKVEGALSKQASIFEMSFIDKVLGNCFSCLNLN